ncbi:hypothetical protein ACHAXR_012515 [Thalassiosira sp. AJA248-18]
MATHPAVITALVALLLAHPLPTRATIYGVPYAFVAPPSGSNKYHHVPPLLHLKSSPPPAHYFFRQTHTTTSLASTTASGSSNNNNNSNNAPPPKTQQQSYNVLYQKVLRAPPSSLSHTFLLDLVTYLQCVFELPNDLPMPYEITVPEDQSNDDDNRAVLMIDSSLSNDPYEACLEVEVIGIFPDDTEVQAGPTMAMVALKKKKDPNNIDDNSSSSGGGGAVSQGLFAASENRIVQSLDRGLQDLEDGRVTIPESATSDDDNDIMSQFDDDDDDEGGVDAAMKRIGYKNAIDAASTTSTTTSSEKTPRNEQKNKKEVKTTPEDKTISIERDGLGNVIIDSVPSPSTTPPPNKASKHNKQKGKKTAKSKTLDPPVSKPSPMNGVSKPSSTTRQKQKKQTTSQQADDEDYAIKMARQQAEALMTTVKAGDSTSSTEGTVAISGGESDFAIMAAKRAAAAAMRLKKKKMEKDSLLKGQERNNDGNDDASMTISSAEQVQKKGKVQDLSKDEMFVKLSRIANEDKKSSWKRTIPKMKTKDAVKSSPELSDSASNAKDKRRPPQPTGPKTTAKVNSPTIKATSKNEKGATTLSSMEKSDDEIQDDIMQIARENEQVQRELKAATDMMPEDEEQELSPEELLEQILKFGEEKEKEEKPGYGFVEGAFEKAKELLRNEEDGGVSSNNSKELGFKDGDISADEMRRKAEEDELRRIFAAGQSVAEERLSKPTSRVSNLAKPTITEDDINALIDADDTVPLNARALDDELAELEVRMSRSQEEESDGPAENKVFDVFSGPEVYNPNVDAETAVNWPGAKEGSRTDVQLAADLSTALKQAQFASAVLSQMREEEVDDEVRYFVGTKELPLERVTLLRNCVNEAVKAGIVEDPEILIGERSRLQMLIDELISQPEERLEEIAMNYKDLLLSDNLVDLIKERLHAMAMRDIDAQREGKEDLFKEVHARERAISMNLVQIAQALVKEAQALGAELEVSMLEIIRSICEVAMNPSHKTEEDTADALTDAVRDMRPLLDDAFVAYLKYAIAEEEGKLARAGLVDDPEHNRWLFVLKIVQEGVYAELSQGMKRYVDHLFYVLRMKTKTERKELLKKLIDVMPTMDVRPFVKVVSNIVSSLGTTVKGDFADGVILGEMTNQLLQLQRDVNELLPPERINELSKDADAWAATQRERLLERRNLTRQRLDAAKQTGDIDVDAVLKKPGVEAERFD